MLATIQIALCVTVLVVTGPGFIPVEVTEAKEGYNPLPYHVQVISLNQGRSSLKSYLTLCPFIQFFTLWNLLCKPT